MNLFASIVIIGLLTSLVFKLVRMFTFWSRQGVKGPGLFEMLSGFSMPFKDYSLKMVAKYGPVHGAYGLTTKSLIINDPELIRELYQVRAHQFRDRFNWNISETTIRTAIPLLQGDSQWKRVRSTVTPTFTARKIKTMMTKINSYGDKFVDNLDQLKNKGIIQMDDLVKSLTMDILCICAYGFDPDSINQPDHPFVTNMKKLLDKDISFGRIISIIAPKLARLFNCQILDPKLVKYFADQAEIIILKYSDHQDTKAHNFIQLMLEANKCPSTNGDYLTKEEMIAQTIVFFIAGVETSSSTINHVIYYLAKNPDGQQRLYQELKDVDQSNFENIIQLKYLNAVIDETFRLAPPFLLLSRISAEDTEVRGIKIPAGTQIEILPFTLHRDPEYWQDPLEFKPERFLEPTHNPWSFLPFGGGPRMCIAERFSMNEIRICCAKLFTRFEFSLPELFEPAYFNGHILLTMKKLKVRIKSRNRLMS